MLIMHHFRFGGDRAMQILRKKLHVPKTKFIPFAMIISLLCTCLVGCSNVSKEEYQALQEQLEQSEIQVAEKEAELAELADKYNESQADNLVLKQYLASTYDAYRYMLINVTGEVYGNGLSQTDWEEFVTASEVPTFEQVSEVIQ